MIPQRLISVLITFGLCLLGQVTAHLEYPDQSMTYGNPLNPDNSNDECFKQYRDNHNHSKLLLTIEETSS